MYLAHFGLARKPFSKTPDPAFLFPSRQHAEALARLSHAVEEREIAVLTGEVGAGKTTLSRALVDGFAERCRFSFVVNPALPPAQLLAAIAEGFGIAGPRRKVDVYAALAERFSALDDEGTFPVVVIDEAQLLPGRAAFDELRLLTNLAADDRPLVGLVLIGQPELRERVAERGGEPFAQRVGVAFHVGPLDAEETGRYLAHRLGVAGRDEPLFDAGAVERLHHHARGLPRRINQLAANALLEAFARDLRRIGADVVDAAAADLAAYMGSGRAAR
jgi:general secretion pathway protein A